MNNQTVKPELKSPEMKEAYIAVHWGQKICCLGEDQTDTHEVSALLTSISAVRKTPWYLLFTPLDQISDEHLTELARILDWFGLDVDGNEVGDIQEFKQHLLNQAFKWDHYGINVASDAIDYLRYNGYAVRWMGYEVEELIEVGYCQLRKGGEGNG